MRKSQTVGIMLAAIFVVSGCAGSRVGVGVGTERGGHHDSGEYHAGQQRPRGYRHPGPPPHARAWGRRAKESHSHHGSHDDGRGHRGGVEIVFDSDLGVHVVIGMPDHYYYNGRYLRIDDGGWEASVELDGAWVTVGSRGVPERLRTKYKNKQGHGKPHKRGGGHGKNKG